MMIGPYGSSKRSSPPFAQTNGPLGGMLPVISGLANQPSPSAQVMEHESMPIRFTEPQLFGSDMFTPTKTLLYFALMRSKVQPVGAGEW